VKTDKLFYRLFLSQPSLITELIPEIPPEGRQEGRQEEAANLVIRLLTRRCGSLSSSLELRVRSLLVNQLEMLGEALLDFSGIKDLENWLAAIS
jgi:predicted transposase YdaD